MNFYILTLGCPKNEVDSEGMGRALAAAGHRQVDDPRHAEAVIVNTCGFIDKAKEESIQQLRRFATVKRRSLGRSGRKLLIAAGCLGQRYAQDLLRQVPELDGVLGTLRWAEIGELLSAAETGARPCWTGSSLVEEPTAGNGRSVRASAYLKIADGCDSACAFCAIPLIKGPQRSRPVSSILAEARQLSAQGAKELVLIAQDTTSYGRDRGEQDGLALLLEQLVAEVPATEWVRVMYTHPSHITDRLLAVMAANSKIVKYLDLPLQHADPNVLRRMLRPLNARQVVARVREAIPGVAIRSAFIVGYPRETEAEFRALLDFLEEMRFDRVGMFQYSREEDTAAAALAPQVSPPVKRKRYQRALAVQQAISLAINRQLVHREMDLLFEGAAEGAYGSVGRSFRDAPEVDGLVFVKQRLAPGSVARVRVTEALAYDLVAEVIA